MPIHSGVWPFLRGLSSASWHSMHSLLATTGFLAASSAPRAMANAKTNAAHLCSADWKLARRGGLVPMPQYAARGCLAATRALTLYARRLTGIATGLWRAAQFIAGAQLEVSKTVSRGGAASPSPP